MNAFRISDVSVARGSKGSVRQPVGRLASGFDLSLPVHIVHGARPGPTLLLLSAIHGEEIFAVEVLRRVVLGSDPESLRGTLVVVPVCNPLSLEQETRNTPFDMLNLNRVFPGKADGWLSERIAAALTEIIERSDAIIHIDGGSVERVIHYIYIKEAEDDWGKQVEAMSKIFGLPQMYRGSFFEGSVTALAAELGIPCIVPEIGGSLLMQDPHYMQEALTGVRNVMVHMGMMDGTVVLPPRQEIITRRTLMRVPHGGIFHPAVGLSELNRPLPGGTHLATIVDPYGLEEVAQIVAPWDDAVIFQMRALMSTVQPGDYAFIIGDASSSMLV